MNETVQQGDSVPTPSSIQPAPASTAGIASHPTESQALDVTASAQLASSTKRPRSWRYPAGEFKVLRLREIQAAEKVDEPAAVHTAWHRHVTSASWFDAERECMVIFGVNTRRRLQGIWLAGIGTLDTVVAHPRDIFRVAVLQAFSAVVIAHNHPSGDTTPSEADVRVTRDLIRAGQLLRIEVLDHLVVGRSTLENPRGFCSLRELGCFYA